ncbi:MAG: T9SS type A sorting domain-containing protein [Cyclobacteriaceae bacterium]
MKKLLLFLCIGFVVLQASAQKVDWYVDYERYDREKSSAFFRTYSFINEITSGPGDQVIIGGVYTDITFLDSLYQSAAETRFGRYRFDNVYLASYGSDGSEEWIRTFVSPNDMELISMDADAQGNIYLFIEGSEAAISGAETFLQDGAGNTGGYQLIKLDPNGNLLWTSDILIDSPEREEDGHAEPSDIAVTPGGEIYVAMTFSFDLKLAPGWTFEGTERDDEPLLVKYGTDGQVLWGVQGFSDWEEDEQSLNVEIDRDGNIIFGGTFSSGRDDSRGLSFSRWGTGIPTTQSENGVFLSKFAPDATLLWLKSFTDGATQKLELEDEYLQDIVVDGTDILLSIKYDTDLIVGSDTLITAQEGDENTAIIKLDGAGNPMWTQEITGQGFANRLGVDPVNNQYLVISDYSNEFTFRNTGTTIAEDLYGGDYFMAIYDRDGNLTGVETTEFIYKGRGGIILNDMPVTYLSDGSLVAGMHFGGAGSFSFEDIPYGQMQYANITIDTAYTVLMKVDLNDQGDVANVDLGPDIAQCEGEVTLDAGVAVSYLWSTGQTDQSITVDTSGVYAVRITDEAGQTASDTVTVDIDEPLVFNFPDTLSGINSVMLQSPVWAENYLWSTGQAIPNISVDSEGYYSLQVTTKNGCITTDSVYAKIRQLSIYYGGTGSGDAVASIIDDTNFYSGGDASTSTIAELLNDDNFYGGGTGNGSVSASLSDRASFYSGGAAAGYAYDRWNNTGGSIYEGGNGSGDTYGSILNLSTFYQGGTGSGDADGSMSNLSTIYAGGSGSGYALSELIVELITQLDEGTLQQPLSVYPNPATNYITLEYPGSQITSVKIYNMSGKKLLEQNHTDNLRKQITLAIANIPAGTYLVVVSARGKKAAYHKLLKE